MKAGLQTHDKRAASAVTRVKVIDSLFDRARVLALLLFQKTFPESSPAQTFKRGGDKVPARVINDESGDQKEADDAERDERHQLQPVRQRKAQQEDDDARQDKEDDR